MAQKYKTLISYDVEEKQNEVKERLDGRGYSATWVSDKGNTCYFPTTTMEKDNIDIKEARNDVQTVCENLNVELLRMFAVPAIPKAGISGVPLG